MQPVRVVTLCGFARADERLELGELLGIVDTECDQFGQLMRPPPLATLALELAFQDQIDLAQRELPEQGVILPRRDPR